MKKRISFGLLSGLSVIIFFIIFAQIFGKDPITFFKDSSMLIRVVMILSFLGFTLIVVKKEYKK